MAGKNKSRSSVTKQQRARQATKSVKPTDIHIALSSSAQKDVGPATPIPSSSTTVSSKRFHPLSTIKPLSSVCAGRLLLFSCVYCPFESTSQAVYTRHRAAHGRLGAHRCAYCSYSCGTAARLHQHLGGHFRPQLDQTPDVVGLPVRPSDAPPVRHWVDPDNRRQCEDCGRQFQSELECAKHALHHQLLKTQFALAAAGADDGAAGDLAKSIERDEDGVGNCGGDSEVVLGGIGK